MPRARHRREMRDDVLEAVYTRQDGVLAQEAQGQTVLLRLADGSYYALDEVGSEIWELCDGVRTVAEIVTELCAMFEAPERVIRADVIEFVDELARESLLIEGA